MKKVKPENEPLKCPVCHHTITMKPESTVLTTMLIYKNVIHKVVIVESYKEQRKTYRALIRSLGYRSMKEYEEESNKCAIIIAGQAIIGGQHRNQRICQ